MFEFQNILKLVRYEALDANQQTTAKLIGIGISHARSDRSKCAKRTSVFFHAHCVKCTVSSGMTLLDGLVPDAAAWECTM